MDAYPRLMWINGRLDEQRIAAARDHDALTARRRASAAVQNRVEAVATASRAGITLEVEPVGGTDPGSE